MHTYIHTVVYDAFKQYVTHAYICLIIRFDCGMNSTALLPKVHYTFHYCLSVIE